MSNKTIILNVVDMHCPSCPKLITMDLEDLKGVIKVESSLEDKTVTVEFDPETTNEELIIKTIGETGYNAKLQG